MSDSLLSKLLRDHPSGRNFGEQSPLTDKVIYAEVSNATFS